MKQAVIVSTARTGLAKSVRGGFNDIIFRDGKLVITHFGKSYSTGEYHQPDGAVWELSYSDKQ